MFVCGVVVGPRGGGWTQEKVNWNEDRKKNFTNWLNLFFFFSFLPNRFNLTIMTNTKCVCVCVRVLLSFDLQLLKNYNLSLSVIRIWRKRRKHSVLDMRDAWIGAWLFFLQQITSNTHLQIELKYTIIIYSYLFKANVLSVVYFLAKISFRSRPVNSVFSKARAKTCKSSILLLLLYWYVYNWTIS